MSLRAARLGTWVYLLAMMVAVIWPGAVPAARIEPFLFGLPFAFAWPALWVAGAVPVLWGLERVERRHREGRAGPEAGGADGPTTREA